MAAKRTTTHSAQNPEKAPNQKMSKQKYVLTLYIAGISPRSSAAIRSIREICDEHLQNRYELEIVDIYQRSALTKKAQIVAAPTLIKKLPKPLRRFIGDLSEKERILIGLDLKTNK